MFHCLEKTVSSCWEEFPILKNLPQPSPPPLAAQIFAWARSAQRWWLHHVAVLLQLVLVLLLLGENQLCGGRDISSDRGRWGGGGGGFSSYRGWVGKMVEGRRGGRGVVGACRAAAVDAALSAGHCARQVGRQTILAQSTSLPQLHNHLQQEGNWHTKADQSHWLGWLGTTTSEKEMQRNKKCKYKEKYTSASWLTSPSGWNGLSHSPCSRRLADNHHVMMMKVTTDIARMMIGGVMLITITERVVPTKSLLQSTSTDNIVPVISICILPDNTVNIVVS